MAAWSESNHIVLRASCGCASRAEYPNEDAEALAKIADERMYTAKEQYFLKNGKQRRT